jgi:signal transduction histidine kinase
LTLPLEMGKKLLGVLDMESEQLNAFREDDVPFLQLLADQVATAIQNASLYESEKSRRRLVETLYNIARALSSSLNPAEVLNQILEHLSEIVSFDRAAVMLRAEDELEIAVARGFPPNYQRIRVSIRENDVFQEICHTQRPLPIADVLERPDWQQVSSLPQARAWLGVPLIYRDEVFGMLSLTRHTPDAYNADEVALAATFAGQAAIALNNARLYDQITRFNQDLESLVRQRTEALQTAYNHLERLDRAKSDFINIASHEFRTPVTVVHGYIQMLLSEPAVQDDPQQLYMLKGIETGANRLTEIVESLLDVAKIDNRELYLYPAPLSVASIVEVACSGLKNAMIERKHSLLIEPSLRELPAIEADPEALRKVFYQLVINAIKYTPDSGKITISGRALAPGEAQMAEGGVEIVVSDTGIGIDPQVNELIFRKFFQTGEVALHSTGKTKFKGGGPGLGLAIALGIVEAHGGRLWAESAGHDEIECPGSHFHVVLPLRQQPPGG